MENQYEQLELLSIRKAAKYLHISRQAVRNLVKDGKIKAIKINDRFKIPLRSVIEFLDRSDQISIQPSPLITRRAHLQLNKNNSDRISQYLDEIIGEN